MSAIGCIRYQTEGRAQVDCEIGNAPPRAFTWLRGGTVAKLHSGPNTIELSKSQLLQIAGLAPAIAEDLAPDLTPEGDEE